MGRGLGEYFRAPPSSLLRRLLLVRVSLPSPPPLPSASSSSYLLFLDSLEALLGLFSTIFRPSFDYVLGNLLKIFIIKLGISRSSPRRRLRGLRRGRNMQQLVLGTSSCFRSVSSHQTQSVRTTRNRAM